MSLSECACATRKSTSPSPSRLSPGRRFRGYGTVGANDQRHREKSREGTMKRSTDRILTTHVGSLPRPDDLRALIQKKQQGEAIDEAAFAARVKTAVAETVRQIGRASCRER